MGNDAWFVALAHSDPAFLVETHACVWIVPLFSPLSWEWPGSPARLRSLATGLDRGQSRVRERQVMWPPTVSMSRATQGASRRGLVWRVSSPLALSLLLMHQRPACHVGQGMCLVFRSFGGGGGARFSQSSRHRSVWQPALDLGCAHGVAMGVLRCLPNRRCLRLERPGSQSYICRPVT